MKYCMHCMNPLEDSNNFCTSCGKSLLNEIPGHYLTPGTKLNNRYIVGAAIGEGGFGITYIGIDIKLDLKVAIKEFFPNGFVNRTNTISSTVNCSQSRDKREFFEKGKKKFLIEAKTLAKFQFDPGIVHVSDFFEENETAYIVMEYLEGKTLADFIEEKGKLTVDETLKILIPIMKTLQKIHKKDLIHRDISPDNIMIMDEQVKLLDFGLAREFSLEDEKSFTTSLKHGYSPHEQYRRRGKQGPWTDVYAMCATIYKCITGIRPDGALDRVLNDELRLPSVLGIDIDTSIENAIMKGLNVKQEDRFQNIGELIEKLNVEEDCVLVNTNEDTNTVLVEETIFFDNSTDDNIKTIDIREIEIKEQIVENHEDLCRPVEETNNTVPANVEDKLIFTTVQRSYSEMCDFVNRFFYPIRMIGNRNSKFEKKVKNAIKAYANKIEKTEVFALFDETLFESGKEGFIMTTSGIISKHMFCNPIICEYSDINTIDIVYDQESKLTRVVLSTKHGDYVIASICGKNDSVVLAQRINEIVKYLYGLDKLPYVVNKSSELEQNL